MSTLRDIGLEQALAETLAVLDPLPPVLLPIERACGFVPARDLPALVDCPDTDVSARDGYAVVAAELEPASPERPVRLRVRGTVAAGGRAPDRVERGSAMRILTGAPLPDGADAVLADEFAVRDGEVVECRADAGPGRNIRRQGEEVRRGDVVGAAGRVLTPAGTGLLAAAGYARIAVHQRPRVAVVATGDEVVAPGEPLAPGQVHASNAVTLLGWLQLFGMEASFTVARDRPAEISQAIEQALGRADAVLTSGGAWKSERDHLTRVLAGLGADLRYHRVRIGPGKAVAFALYDRKPVFCLAGGPSSNEMGFLQLALPGLLRLAGRDPRPFPCRRAVLASPVSGDRDWTQLFRATLSEEAGRLIAHPLPWGNRLQAMAEAEALVRLPEGLERREAGEEVEVQVLS